MQIYAMTQLKPGDKAPAFKGIDQSGKTHSLTDYKGKKVILFFYPKASTPTCTVEACNLRDNFEQLQDKGYVLLGVSADNAGAQEKFATKHSLPFPLLADVDKTIIQAYQVWGPKKFMGKEFDGIHRTTFVIDEKGFISQVIAKVNSKDHAAQILQG